MNIKDIMIGDWVMKPYPDDRESLRKGQIELDDFYLEEEWETISNCKPIPLTKEILEKNGFTRFSTDYVLWNDKRAIIGLSNPSSPEDYKDNYWIKIGVKSYYIIYVHQLQHLLRLIGYDKEIVI